MRVEASLNTPRPLRLGPAITAVVLLLSLILGFGVFASPQQDPPKRSATKPTPPAGWAKVIAALNSKEPATPSKKPTNPVLTAKPVPPPELVPWPPETLAFAGKKAGDEMSANALQMKFCWCPPGTFVMGSPKTEKDHGYGYSYERQIEVKLTKGFWLAKFELTQEQWHRLMGTNLSQQYDIKWRQFWWESENAGFHKEWWDRNQRKWLTPPRAKYESEPDFGEGPAHPMYYVNHLEATDFCRKLTEQERQAGRLPPGWEYRLPTEAQWEYACRAGTTTATAFGDTLSSTQANFNGDFPYNGALKGPTPGRFRSFYVNRPGQAQPVGSYRPNAWGLHDMHGNVWEWCRDWDGIPPGGTDPEKKFGDMGRVIRGGSWYSHGKQCRSASRKDPKWSDQDSQYGFRVALVQLDPKPKPAPEPPVTPLPPGILTNSIGMKLAPIPPGSFLMGSPVEEAWRPWLGRDEADYEEQHPVTIRQPFYLGVYLVTQEQYHQLMANAPGYEPSYFSHQGEGKDKVKEFKDIKQFPRERVSWQDAQEFCRRLSEVPAEKQAGRRYRLPTEEEWEYACRAGTSTPYYTGQTLTPQQANFTVYGPDGVQLSAQNLGRTTPVGSYPPNPFGLHDMHGNLAQWCEDPYAPYPHDQRNPNNYQGYVARGGSWFWSSISCRSASRDKGSPPTKYNGFRVAVSLVPPRPPR